MKLLGVLTGLLLASSVAAQEPTTNFAGTYYCKITASGGLKKDPATQSWEATTFNVKEQAYKVAVTDTGQVHDTEYLGKWRVYKIKVNDFGEAPNKYGCRGRQQIDPNDGEKIAVSDSGATQCYFFGSVYHLDFKANLIQVMFEGGYMDPDKQNNDTPYIAVGKCDKIG